MPGTKPENPIFRPLGNTGLECYPIGFGCYRISNGNAAHEQALRDYLARGGNLIDTSANYGDGRSETLVGKVLGDVPRDRVIVVTKGGYIQGQNMALALGRKFPEVVEYGEGLWHSIHPEFLETQIRSSAERMGLSRIDVYLLHNPEYYLEHAGHQGPVAKREHDEFYRRVKEAFRFLEAKVAGGMIGWYGISSNNFGMPISSPTMTRIERCWQAAESVSSDHHFRVVQLPLNLYETGGALVLNNEGKTALEFCRSKGIGVLINRPLNAFAGNRMVRLADFVRRGQQPPGKEQLHALLEPVRAMEERLQEQFDIPLIYGDRQGIARYLETIVPQMQSLAHWQEIFGEYVIQPIQQWATQCQQLYGDREEWRKWWGEFVKKLPEVFEEISRYLAASQQAVSDAVRAQLTLAGYPETRESLSRMAQNVLLRLDGVSCVLNGMRQPEYVADSMGVAGLEPVDSLSILRNFSRMNRSETTIPIP
jgi:aryl-alcohol dehydrogenase-like predicted oxidoreductase